MITDPILLEVHYADMLLAAAKRQSTRMSEPERRRILRAAELHYSRAVAALAKAGQKETV